ncbi:MAG: polyphenol oxidase family protein, partial [Bdellovibrionales bacterium]|nr:polyphenol oxidase family protein [Bdellovibrionales bacterium]
MISLQDSSDLTHFASTNLIEHGLLHGFLGRDFVAPPSDTVQISESFRDSFGYPLTLLHQVHGNVCVDESSQWEGGKALPEGDAFLFSRYSRDPRAFGVKTADCVPVVLVGERYCAVIHAGWRGLAAGILGKVSHQLAEHEDLRGVKALIGPAAGKDEYEVGLEVVQAIGSQAEYSSISHSKVLLDLEGTARN